MANEVVERLRRDFQESTYRHVYDSGFLDSSIATQIKVLREQRGWKQSDLAREAKTGQSRISEIEDVNYSSWSIRTLRRLAKAFDVRLKVSFEEFGTLLTDFTKLNRTSLERCSFRDDPAFREPEQNQDEAASLSYRPGISNNLLSLARMQAGDGAMTFWDGLTSEEMIWASKTVGALLTDMSNDKSPTGANINQSLLVRTDRLRYKKPLESIADRKPKRPGQRGKFHRPAPHKIAQAG
jgi:transcriptional regulator with XRE-family HTH domain